MSTDDGELGVPEVVDLEFGPRRFSAFVAIFAGVMATATSAPYHGLSLPFGLLGLVFLVFGALFGKSRGWISLGVTSIFIGVLVAGVFDAITVPMTLMATVGTMIAWDVGQHAVTIGEQFSRESPTRRGEATHAAASTIVGVLAAGVAYGIYVAGSGGQPALAILFLGLGATFLIWALRD